LLSNLNISNRWDIFFIFKQLVSTLGFFTAANLGIATAARIPIRKTTKTTAAIIVMNYSMLKAENLASGMILTPILRIYVPAFLNV